MKKVFLFLLLSLLSIPCAFAQSFEFETTRTPEVPGFFMVRIFPSVNNVPLPIQNVFVANYKDADEGKYEELLPFLREFGGKVIPADEVEKYSVSKNNRLIFLGEAEEGFLNFEAQKSKKVLEEFETFAIENLEPTLLQNVTAKFGGNISEVYPAQIESVGFGDVFFIGKFEKEMKTRMEIQGISAEGEIKAIAPLHLHDAKFANGPLSKELPAIWEELWKQSNGEEDSKFDWRNFMSFSDFFPVLLLIAGLIILFVTVRKMMKRNKKAEEKLSIDENGIPSHQNWKDVPFEVKKKDKK
jgi:hypothetical protein